MAKQKRKPHLVMGMTRAEWCKRIGGIVTPKKIASSTANLRKGALKGALKGQQVQMERDGCLFGGKAPYQKKLPKPQAQRNRWAGLENYREAVG